MNYKSGQLGKVGVEIPRLFDRYQKGYYQEVYDELLTIQERIYEPQIYEEALRITKEIMRRVRDNIELLIPRLRDIGYHFGEGFSESPEEEAYWEQAAPIYRAPTPETPEHVAELEQLAGTLPLTLKCCYEVVGSVNFVGTFPISENQKDRIAYGSDLDPLFIYSVEMVLTMGEGYWHDVNKVSIAPDRYFKFGYGGGGPYAVQTPCRTFDASLKGYEDLEITFVNYLRQCFRWGGFPGLESDNRLSHDKLEYLTKDLLSF